LPKKPQYLNKNNEKILCLVVVCCFLSCKKEETKKESLYPTTTEEVAQSLLNWKGNFEGKETVSLVIKLQKR
jgi:hypothetical protein